MKKLLLLILIVVIIYPAFEAGVVKYRDNKCTIESQGLTGNVDPTTGEPTESAQYVTKAYFEYSKCKALFPIKTPLLNFINSR